MGSAADAAAVRYPVKATRISHGNMAALLNAVSQRKPNMAALLNPVSQRKPKMAAFLN